ncbi:glycosyltransferase 6 [Aspergillus udagawae]|nr:glycosyltransferase 6 [Aspergillus udagawae]
MLSCKSDPTMAKSYEIGSRRFKFNTVGHVLLAFLGVFGLLSLFSNHYRIAAPEAFQHTPTIGKVTMIYGNISIYERTLETHKEHSRRLGYPLTVLRNPILNGIWNKLAILQSVLLRELEKPADQRLQWLFWFDGDTVLMNPDMPLETFLPPPELSNAHLLVSRDWNGLHSGVFFLRVHPWSVELLSAAIAYPVVKPDVQLIWFEQSAISNVLAENEYFALSTVYCPLRWFNAYTRHPNGIDINPDTPLHLQVHPGDLLVHFPGTPKANLTRTLTPYLEIAESHSRDWEVPLEETRYVEETKRFWTDLRFGSFGRITSIPEPIDADAAEGT